MSNNVRVQTRRRNALARRENDVVNWGRQVAQTNDSEGKKQYERKLELAKEEVATLKKKIGSQLN